MAKRAVDIEMTAIAAALTFAIVFGVLMVQLVGVRPRLARRSDAVLAGRNAPRSRAVHVALEMAVGGILLLSS